MRSKNARTKHNHCLSGTLDALQVARCLRGCRSPRQMAVAAARRGSCPSATAPVLAALRRQRRRRRRSGRAAHRSQALGTAAAADCSADWTWLGPTQGPVSQQPPPPQGAFPPLHPGGRLYNSTTFCRSTSVQLCHEQRLNLMPCPPAGRRLLRASSVGWTPRHPAAAHPGTTAAQRP